MHHNQIYQKVFSVCSYNVIQAAYKNSVYYLAGSNDITDYVKRIESDHSKVNETIIEKGLKRFLNDHPELNVLNVPMFDFYLLDDPTTSAQFVSLVCKDVFHYNEKQCEEVINALNTVGEYRIGTYTDEMCITFACMVQNGNIQLKQNLGFDKIKVSHPNSDLNQNQAAILKLESLIRRDFPEDDN